MLFFDFLIVALLGLSFGSFANVCINRLPYEFDIISPSRCPLCKTNINYYDNIPLLSYILLKGFARCCGKGISIQYPIIELVVMFFALSIYLYLGISLDAILLFIFTLSLIIIFVTDFKEYIIPNSITYLFIIIGIVVTFIEVNPFNILIIDSLLGGIISGVSFYTISKLFLIIRKKEGLGMGDVKLISMIGFWIGLEISLLVIVLSSFLGLIVAVFLIMLKKIKYQQYLPYGCFISVATLVMGYVKISTNFNLYYLIN